MKAEISARMEGEEKIKIQLRFSGNGFDNADMVHAEAKKYKADAEKIGFIWNYSEYVAIVAASPEACEPFNMFAEKHGLEIVML